MAAKPLFPVRTESLLFEASRAARAREFSSSFSFSVTAGYFFFHFAQQLHSIQNVGSRSRRNISVAPYLCAHSQKDGVKLAESLVEVLDLRVHLKCHAHRFDARNLLV